MNTDESVSSYIANRVYSRIASGLLVLSQTEFEHPIFAEKWVRLAARKVCHALAFIVRPHRRIVHNGTLEFEASAANAAVVATTRTPPKIANAPVLVFVIILKHAT